MAKTKKNRLPIGSPQIEPATPRAPEEIPFEEPLPRPATPPLNVGELLANVKPDTMDELNAMNIAINTHNGES